MPTNFTEKFAASIVSVLGCHDRVIFKGYLPFGRESIMPRHKLRRPALPFSVSTASPRREKLVQKLLRQGSREDGLVTVLQVMETCRTVKLLNGKGRLRLAFARRPQRVL